MIVTKSICKSLAKSNSPYSHLAIHLAKISSPYFGKLQQTGQYIFFLLYPFDGGWGCAGGGLGGGGGGALGLDDGRAREERSGAGTTAWECEEAEEWCAGDGAN